VHDKADTRLGVVGSVREQKYPFVVFIFGSVAFSQNPGTTGHNRAQEQRMNRLSTYAIAGLIAAGAAMGATTLPAKAGVDVSIGVGGPLYYGYDYYRPCRWYFDNDFPAPRRCYREYTGFYGPGVYISSGFVFRDRAHYYRYRGRDDFRHWRNHNWNRHH
jgi:hypothetical protein